MNEIEYEEFYLKYRQIAKSYAYGILEDWYLADDISQEVLYKMYTIRNDLDLENEKMLYALIRRAAVNKALDYKKKSSTKHEFSCHDDETASVLDRRIHVNAEDQILRQEENKFMHMILERFRAEQPINYEILIQTKFMNVPVETVAEEFGLTKSGVNNRIYKAKRWLKEEYSMRKLMNKRKLCQLPNGQWQSLSYRNINIAVRSGHILQ